MMTLNELTEAICTTIKTWLPELKTCTPHGGRFDGKEIARVSGRAPAVFVAVLSTGKGIEVGNGQQDVPVTFAAYVAATDQRKLARAQAALNMVEGLVSRIYQQNWGFPDRVYAAKPAASRNLYSGIIAQKGVALWAVTWPQTVRLGEDVYRTEFPMPSELYLGMAPDIGEGHEDDYRLIAGREVPE
jgi:phage gp37-like protein